MTRESMALLQYTDEAASGIKSQPGTALTAIARQLVNSQNSGEEDLGGAILIGVISGFDVLAKKDGLGPVCDMCGVRHPLSNS